MTFTGIPDSVLAHRDWRAQDARRRAHRIVRLAVVIAAACAVVLCAATACKPVYVTQPPPPDADVATPVTPAECVWTPSGRAASLAVSSRVTAGEASPDGAYPWACAVTTASGRQYCGASLIAPAIALTAAHCQVVPGDLVRCGCNDLRSDVGVRVSVREARNHPSWGTTTGGNDVAVLVLGAPVSGVEPVALVARTPEYPIALVAIGWGATVAGGPTVPVQQHVVVPLVPWGTCAQEYYGTALRSDMLCAGDPLRGTDTCQGDSGGPYVVGSDEGWRLAGVTSWGAECGTAPGVATNVAAHLEWIAACAGVTP